jgi:hypothetical protein
MDRVEFPVTRSAFFCEVRMESETYEAVLAIFRKKVWESRCRNIQEGTGEDKPITENVDFTAHVVHEQPSRAIAGVIQKIYPCYRPVVVTWGEANEVNEFDGDVRTRDLWRDSRCSR